MKIITVLFVLLFIFCLPFYQIPNPRTLVPVNVLVANFNQARALRSIPADEVLPRIWGCYATYTLRGDMTEIWARIGEAEYVKVQDDHGKYIENACADIILTDPMPVGSGFGNT